MIGEARAATCQSYDLAEGPFWDPVREQVLWVDIRRGQVLAGSLRPSGAINVTQTVGFPGTVGAVAPTADGDWLVAGADRLFMRTADGEVVPGPRLLPASSGRRLNDGKPDPAGRYVVGSLCLNGPSSAEMLAVVDFDGTVTEIDSDLTMSNGLAWTPDGALLYSVDTLRRRVYRRAYDPRTGTAAPRSVFIELDDGLPDGICLDAAEHLWVAVWGLGQVCRYTPDGQLDVIVRVPAPHTSSVTFAGPDLGTLVITTATQDLTERHLAEYPLSGRLFTFEPGVRGFPQTLWSGRWGN